MNSVDFKESSCMTIACAFALLFANCASAQTNPQAWPPKRPSMATALSELDDLDNAIRLFEKHLATERSRMEKFFSKANTRVLAQKGGGANVQQAVAELDRQRRLFNDNPGIFPTHELLLKSSRKYLNSIYPKWVKVFHCYDLAINKLLRESEKKDAALLKLEKIAWIKRVTLFDFNGTWACLHLNTGWRGKRQVLELAVVDLDVNLAAQNYWERTTPTKFKVSFDPNGWEELDLDIDNLSLDELHGRTQGGQPCVWTRLRVDE